MLFVEHTYSGLITCQAEDFVSQFSEQESNESPHLEDDKTRSLRCQLTDPVSYSHRAQIWICASRWQRIRSASKPVPHLKFQNYNAWPYPCLVLSDAVGGIIIFLVSPPPSGQDRYSIIDFDCPNMQEGLFVAEGRPIFIHWLQSWMGKVATAIILTC